MDFRIELEREADGRWIADIPQMPGVMCCGAIADEAIAKTQSLALRVLAERIEASESRPEAIHISIPHMA